MKFIFIILSLFPLIAFAHPSVAIKFDSNGNLFYSDLHNVYKIAPDGEKTVAVPNVHSHELSIDSKGNVYGEHLWYEGDVTKKWGHYVWMLSPDGKISKIKDSTEGFLTNYGFLRDGKNNLYFVERGETTLFKKIDQSGKISEVGRGNFKNVRWQFVDEGGRLFFYDNDDLQVLNTDGSFRIIKKALSSHAGPSGFDDKTHNMMGLWMDKKGSIYVANYSGREVKKISGNGDVQVVYKSNDLWSPTAGAFDKNNDLWLLEWSQSNEVRITKVPAEKLVAQKLTGSISDSSWSRNYKTFLGLIPIMIVIAYFILRKRKKYEYDQIH